MSTENILTIIGLFLTLIFGYFRLKSVSLNRKTTEIIFLKNASISLFKTIVKNLDDVEIRFKGNKINENLILLKGTFFNSGNVDIQKSMVHKPLEIELPDNYSWVSHKLIDTSDGLGISANVIGNRLIFDWDLLKEGEYFTFDSLIEYKFSKEDEASADIGKNLVKRLTINHRITDLKKITKENSIPRPIGFGGLAVVCGFILAIILLLGYVSFGQFIFPSYRVLHEITLEGQKKYVTLDANNRSTVEVSDEKGDELADLQINDLQNKVGSRIMIAKEPVDYLNLIFWGLICILYIIVFIAMLVGAFREKKLYNKLRIVADKYEMVDFENRRRFGFQVGFFTSPNNDRA